MFNLCRPIMPSGAKCHAPALRGKPYCYYHTRLHRFTAAPPIEVDGNLRLGVLEDRSAIQIALAQVLDALYSGRLDPRRAGLSLYGIQIASQNVERNPLIIPHHDRRIHHPHRHRRRTWAPRAHLRHPGRLRHLRRTRHLPGRRQSKRLSTQPQPTVDNRQLTTDH